MPIFDVRLVAYHEVEQIVTVEADDATDAKIAAVEQAVEANRGGWKEGDWTLTEPFVKEINALDADQQDDPDMEEANKEG